MMNRRIDGNQPTVTFVILNWNQVDLTIECLDSLYQQDYSNFRVIVVDNGSTDQSVTKIGLAYPQMQIIENSKNVGYSKGNNIGISAALESGTDYIFLLNNDTKVDPQMLHKLVSSAESDSKIGITGPTMLFYDQPEIIWCAGNLIDWKDGNTTRIGVGQHLSSVANESQREVDFITSCAICIKKAVFDDIGLFDERFFIYYDETDWFARASRAGWKTIYVPDAIMWHKVSATMEVSSPRTDYYMIRNKFLFLSKNLKGRKRSIALLRAGLINTRTIMAYTIKNHRGKRLLNRNAKWLAMRDAIVGNWGETKNDFKSLRSSSAS